MGYITKSKEYSRVIKLETKAFTKLDRDGLLPDHQNKLFDNKRAGEGGE